MEGIVGAQNHDCPRGQRSDAVKPWDFDCPTIVHPNRELEAYGRRIQLRSATSSNLAGTATSAAGIKCVLWVRAKT